MIGRWRCIGSLAVPSTAYLPCRTSIRRHNEPIFFGVCELLNRAGTQICYGKLGGGPFNATEVQTHVLSR